MCYLLISVSAPQSVSAQRPSVRAVLTGGGAEARGGRLCPRPANDSKSLALEGKFLIPVAMAELLGHASCRKAALCLLRLSMVCPGASLVSGPLNPDLFFISASQKQAKSQRKVFEGFLLLYIISVLPSGFRYQCMPWGFFFSPLLTAC